MPLSLTLAGNTERTVGILYTWLAPFSALITVIKCNSLSEGLGSGEMEGGNRGPGFHNG